MQVAEGSGAGVDDLPGILDDGPLSEEDLAAVRAFLDDPEGATDDGELVHMSPAAVLAVRAELDAVSDLER
jgi:hypothetical protein